MVETERSMSLNIKNPDVEALVDEVAKLAGRARIEVAVVSTPKITGSRDSSGRRDVGRVERSLFFVGDDFTSRSRDI